jgi:hypothetical protein
MEKKSQRFQRSITENMNKYIFILGNGSSLASANVDLMEVLGPLSIDNFINVMGRMKQDNIDQFRALSDRHFDFKKCGDVFVITDHIVARIEEVTNELGLKNVSDLFMVLKQDPEKILSGEEKMNMDEFGFIEAIFETVAAYYQCFQPDYLQRLWEVIRLNKSPVVSLNWDINFEKVVYENTGVSMYHYYGRSIFDNSNKAVIGELFKPVVTILKPHGSLNWYFIANENARRLYGPHDTFGGNYPKNCYDLYVSNQIDPREAGAQRTFVLPPLEPSEIPLLNKTSESRYWDPYWRRKEKIFENILLNIRSVAANSRILVIIGYSFPKEDTHILKLLQDNKFEEVWVFDTKRDVFSRICEYFPRSKPRFFPNGFNDILNVDDSVWAG